MWLLRGVRPEFQFAASSDVVELACQAAVADSVPSAFDTTKDFKSPLHELLNCAWKLRVSSSRRVELAARELADPDDLELACFLDDEVLQKGRTRDMVFSVPELVARLSAVCPLLPGDLIFTGTPPGVGMARRPPRYLTAGTTLVSTVENVGELRNLLVAG